MVKNPSANAGDVRDAGSIRKIPWRRAWQPTPVFLPGEFPGQRGLANYGPWSHKELGMTERLTLSHFTLEKRLNTEEKDENKAVRMYLKYLYHIYLNV